MFIFCLVANEYAEGPVCTYPRIFLNRQLFLSGFKSFPVHTQRIRIKFAGRHESDDISGFTLEKSSTLVQIEHLQLDTHVIKHRIREKQTCGEKITVENFDIDNYQIIIIIIIIIIFAIVLSCLKILFVRLFYINDLYLIICCSYCFIINNDNNNTIQ